MQKSIDWQVILEETEVFLKSNPEDCNAGRRRAQATGGLGYINKALGLIEKHLEKHPDDEKAWDLRCAYLIDKGNLAAAIESSNRALSIDPDYKIGYYNRACAYALSGNQSAALVDLEEAINFDNDLRLMAKNDESFRILGKNKKFRELINLIDKAP
jgi:tetratricopeptide (TPR) repeat protein